MRIQRFALMSTCVVVLAAGCSSRQYAQSTRLSSPSSSADQYLADPPAESPMVMPREPGLISPHQQGPVTPVPVPPATGVSHVKSVGYSRTLNRLLGRKDECVQEPKCGSSNGIVCCPPQRYVLRPGGLLGCFCPKEKCTNDPCVTDQQGCVDQECCTTECVPAQKYSCFGLFSKWCRRHCCKPKAQECCTEEKTGCTTDGCCESERPTYKPDCRPTHGHSPLAAPLQDPFARDSSGHSAPPIHKPASEVPDVPKESVAPKKSVAPTAPSDSRPRPETRTQPTPEVELAPPPPVNNGTKVLDPKPVPMPNSSQTYVEPRMWPRLQGQSGVANGPPAQNTWSTSWRMR